MSSEIKTEKTETIEGVQEMEVKLVEETVHDEQRKEDEDEEEDEEALPHSEFLDIFEEGLALIVQDPLLCDLPIQVTLEEVNSQIALEYGQAMTVRVCKADGEVMPIVVVQSATVLDLKKAIQRYLELKQQREGGIKHISWRYVWRTFHLAFNGERLEDDKKKLKDMAATPANEKELERILVELQKLTLHREQLNNRLHMLAMLKEFRQNAGYSSEAVCPTDEKDEYGKIEEDLKELSAKKLALQALKEELEGAGFSSTQIYDPSNNEIVTVDKPPSHPGQNPAFV
ncbi:U11/U12 small nuclear ribonucleoprotein 25 kDa protein [Silurus meridionalis]|nr:U11/U12 small nuclear ribonucleoprotein 25 kDa protein [Silurus meridionalis]